MPVSTALSANIEVGGRRVPLSSQSIDKLAPKATDATAAKAAIEAKVAAGITFALSAGADISVSLQDIVEWMTAAAGDFDLPDVVGDIFAEAGGSAIDDMSITITAFSVNTAGAFNIALVFDFGPATLAETLGVPKDMADWLNVDDIGLAFSYKRGA